MHLLPRRLTLRPIVLTGLLAALCTLSACEGTGGAEPVGPADVVDDGIVTYTFRASIPGLEPGPLGAGPPAPALADLARDPRLGRLSVAAGGEDGPPVVDAELVFGSVAEYLTWRESPAAAGLLGDLEAAAPDTLPFATSLRVRRPSLYREVVGQVEAGAGGGGREVESVTCNYDCTRIDITYKTRGNEAGGAAGGGAGEGVGDAGDIDAVTMVCTPGLAGMVEECTASN